MTSASHGTRHRTGQASPQPWTSRAGDRRSGPPTSGARGHPPRLTRSRDALLPIVQRRGRAGAARRCGPLPGLRIRGRGGGRAALRGHRRIWGPERRRCSDQWPGCWRAVAPPSTWTSSSAQRPSSATQRPIRWPAFRAARLAVTQGVAQAGMPTVLLGPLIPEHLEDLPARRWVGDIGGGSNPGTPQAGRVDDHTDPRCTKLVHVDAEGLGPPRVDPAPHVHPASLADGRLAARGVTCRRRRGPCRAGAGRRRPRRGSSRRSTG